MNDLDSNPRIEERGISRRRLIVGTGAALGAAALAGVIGRGGQQTQAQSQGPATPNALGSPVPPEVSQAASDWPLVQGDYKAHRDATSSAINASNVGQLQVAWRLPINVTSYYGAITAPPIVLGDTIYVQDMQSNVYALDRASGQLKWSHIFNAMSYGPNGVAIGYGMIYGATGTHGEAFAIRADNGQEVWRRKLTTGSDDAVLMAPTVYDNVVYISTTPAYRGGSKGIFYALDAKTGFDLWQFDTTTDNLWGAAHLNAGGGVWYPASVDDKGNIYFGTGNPAPFPADNGASRPGPNLYTSAMVSLDPTTGAVRWYVQAAPHDLLDHDFQHTPVLATVDINGKQTNLAIGAGKTGTVIAADADTGKIVWQTKVGEHNQYGDGAPLPATPVTVLPGTYGGVESPMAFADGTLFVPVLNLPSKFSSTSWDIPAGQTLADATGELLALNAADGSVKWQVKLDTFVDAAATVAGNVVFTGGLDGVVRGYDTATGKEVWTYQAAGGLNAPLAAAGDMLFVPVGSPLYTKAGNAPKPETGLLAFKLGGNASGTPEVLPAVPAQGAAPASAATPSGKPVPPPAPANGTAAATTSASAITIELVDIAFKPNAFAIPANTPTTVTLHNAGALPHNFSIDKLKISVNLDPGQTKQVTINAPAGTYQYYCNVPGHREAGMVGTLTVK